MARFEQLGGPAVREAAGRFWQDPTAASWAAYTETVLPWYGRKPWPAEAFQRIHLNLDILFHFARDEFRRFNLLPDIHQSTLPDLGAGWRSGSHLPDRGSGGHRQGTARRLSPV